MFLSGIRIQAVLCQIIIVLSVSPVYGTADNKDDGKTTSSPNVIEESSVQEDACEVDDIEENIHKYIYLRKLQVENENGFYKCLINNADTMLPIIYTPVVGEACLNYKTVVDNGGAKGLTLSLWNTEDLVVQLNKWKESHKENEVKAVVVTDGGRILGLGDLGANGMGIPVGKLALYTALGGVDPRYCLPVTLDVGTNKEEYLNTVDTKYVGERKIRETSEKYDQFIDKFIKAVVNVYGQTTLIQFEDFDNTNANRLLKKYENDYTVFNDDIQGTAAVALAGILTAARFRETKITDAKVLILGAGSAAFGIGTLIVDAMGNNREESRKKIYMINSKGLLTSKQCGNPEFKEDDERRDFCHVVEDGKNTNDLAEIILWLKPNTLIGVSGKGGLFTKEVLKNLKDVNPDKAPIVMPLSNPTANSECNAKDAFYAGCLFAGGSPFDPVLATKETFNRIGLPLSQSMELKPMQCNNANIFPGVAQGIIVAKMKKVPNEVFLIAAKVLANKCVKQEDFDNGSLFPQTKYLRECSVKIAGATVKYALENGLSELKEEGWKAWSDEDAEKFVRKYQYKPK